MSTSRKTSRINAYLIGAILTLSVLPLIASYLLLDEVLESAIGLAVKPDTKVLLSAYRDDLKTLKTLDPDNQEAYKSRFLAAGEELVVYDQPELLRQVLRDTYLTYYLSLFVVILAFSLMGAVWLSRKVARSYQALANSDIKKAEKIQELSYFDQWQAIAGKLAHEINNPLTPIEMMVSNLPRTYANANPEAFAACLADTKAVVSEEVHKLKEMVSHFSQFSKLPEPVLKPHNIFEHCQTFIRQHQQGWPSANISLNDGAQNIEVAIDHLLFNQCLLNIINNAVQANKDKAGLVVTLSISKAAGDNIAITVFNDGKPIDADAHSSLFKMYYSSKSSKENMGLGLAIVRKIILDHGGDICCLPLTQGAAFKMTLPLITSKNKKTDEQ
ncbi:MAG: HAMP domain-containing histidine kinase [Algicola sp.]|nr:HAMP domain-containing histidine kinase [Algicola sp.]